MKKKGVFVRNSSIKKKLITISLILLIIPMFVIGLMSYNQSASSLDGLGEQNLKNSVEMTLEIMEVLQGEVERGNIPLERSQESVKEIILGEKNADGTRPIKEDIDLGENGYIFIADINGNLLAHPTIEGENTWERTDVNGNNYAQEYITIGREGGGYSSYPYALPSNPNQIEDKITYSKADEGWGWVVIASTYMMDFNQPASELLRTILVVTIVTVIIGFVIIWLFANSISNPIKLVSEQIYKLSKRDLSMDPVQIKSKDEIGQLGQAINELQIGFKEILASLADSSQSLYGQSEEMTQSTNEIQIGAEQIAFTMEELASGSESQANNISDLSSVINTFSETIIDVNQNADDLDEKSQSVLTLTNGGSELMKKSTVQMEKIEHIVQDAVEKMSGLDEKSKEISNLVTVIMGVADQTNLLALNAAIEAARAGEHGKGFAVVADEVRKLAEQVSESVKDITGIVNGIQEESAVVAHSLGDSYKEVKEGATQLNQTSFTFNDIRENVEEIVRGITSTRESLTTISAGSQEVNSTIEEIASISQESAAGIEEISATAQQSSSGIEELASNSEELAKLAENLNDVVKRFKL